MSPRFWSLMRPLLTMLAAAAIVVLVLPQTDWFNQRLTRPSDWPSAPADGQQDTRLLALPPPPAGTGAYAWVQTRPNGDPVRYDPCRPIRVVINPTGMPAGGLDLIREALADVSTATGLQFIEEGVTTERPRKDRPGFQEGLYGDRWAPVLVGWATAKTDPNLKGHIAGYGGSLAVGRDVGDLHYVTGQVVLDIDDLTGPDGTLRPSARAVVVHELGHLVGLDHVDDPSQLMYASTETTAGARPMADGDRQGMRIAGDGPCYPHD